MKRGSKPKPEVSPKIAAIRRLSEDGASSNAAIRKRIAHIAAERGLPESETSKVMGRLLTRDVMHFAKKHRVNLDWLIAGDLKGLLETARGCPSRPRQPVLTPDELHRAQKREILELAKSLNDEQQGRFLKYLRALADGGDAA